MEILSQTTNFDIFKCDVIINLIRYRYDIVKKYTVNLLFIPFIVYLVTLISYVDIVIPSY
jgi:hypothetical protein